MHALTRRRFLGWIGGTAAGVALAPTLDLERLLWTPGAKTILIPETAGPMVTTSLAWQAQMIHRHLERACRHLGQVEGDKIAGVLIGRGGINHHSWVEADNTTLRRVTYDDAIQRQVTPIAVTLEHRLNAATKTGVPPLPEYGLGVDAVRITGPRVSVGGLAYYDIHRREVIRVFSVLHD